MNFFRWLLLPFSILYSLAVRLRNFMYDRGFCHSYKIDIPSIVVGNLSAGGTGKTPHTEMLVKMLRQEYFTAILSRGYGRRTKGFVMADEGMNARDLGDEPFQFHEKFDDVMIAVDGNRERGIKMLLQQIPQPDVILLDDAFQHRKVTGGLNILLTDYNCPFYRDLPLPTGSLRDNKDQKKRANIIIVTKCPPFISASEKTAMIKHIDPGDKQKVVFSSIHYNDPVPLFESAGEASFENAVLVTGIANPKPLLRQLDGKYKKIIHKKFPDHHQFSTGDLRSVLKSYRKIDSKSKCILTTEKDAMRLKDHPKREILAGIPIYYLPIEVHLLNSVKHFEAEIFNFISTFKKAD